MESVRSYIIELLLLLELGKLYVIQVIAYSFLNEKNPRNGDR